jgi:hypothetical protein
MAETARKHRAILVPRQEITYARGAEGTSANLLFRGAARIAQDKMKTSPQNSRESSQEDDEVRRWTKLLQASAGQLRLRQAAKAVGVDKVRDTSGEAPVLARGDYRNVAAAEACSSHRFNKARRTSDLRVPIWECSSAAPCRTHERAKDRRPWPMQNKTPPKRGCWRALIRPRPATSFGGSPPSRRSLGRRA